MNERVEIGVQPDEPMRGEVYTIPTNDLVEQLREENLALKDRIAGLEREIAELRR